jgi:stearoyl-CoA desaturase (delta-9 desaturase)
MTLSRSEGKRITWKGLPMKTTHRTCISAPITLGANIPATTEAIHERAPLRARIATLAVIILPFLGMLAAPFLVWGWGFSWVDLGMLLGFAFLTLLGITVGFHRLFTHASFETPTFVKIIFAALGSMAIQGSLFDWVAMHRRHHQHSDTKDDPHTPHHSGRGFWGVVRGAWHSHIGWFFEADPVDMSRYIKDLRNIRALRVVNRLFPLWIVLTLLLPALLGGLITLSWHGALTGLIWVALSGCCWSTT